MTPTVLTLYDRHNREIGTTVIDYGQLEETLKAIELPAKKHNWFCRASVPQSRESFLSSLLEDYNND